MGYLNKETITVDAILTRKGRELLALGRSAFQITQFAVSDDEIDYGLWNPAHPLGTEYYGAAIENMPIVEASPDETQNMRHKLASLAGLLPGGGGGGSGGGGAPVGPVVTVPGITSLNFVGNTGEAPIRPTTTLAGDVFSIDSDTGYTLTLSNGALAFVEVTIPSSLTSPTPRGQRGGQTNRPITVIGKEFRIRPRLVSGEANATITIEGNTSFAKVLIPITVLPPVE